MFTIRDVEAFRLYGRYRAKIVRGRWHIEHRFPIDDSQPDSPQWDFEELCKQIGMQDEFNDLLVTVARRARGTLSKRLQLLAADLEGQAILAAKTLRSERQSRYRNSKRAKFYAESAAIYVKPGFIPDVTTTEDDQD